MTFPKRTMALMITPNDVYNTDSDGYIDWMDGMKPDPAAYDDGTKIVEYAIVRRGVLKNKKIVWKEDK